MRACVGVLIATAIAACSNVDFSGTRFRCDADEPCPAGLECIAQMCTDPGADPDAADCVPAGVAFSDDFEDGVAAPLWLATAESGTTVEEVGGVLVLTPADGSVQARFASYETGSSFSLTDNAFSIEIVTMVDTSTMAQVEVNIGAAGNNRVYFVQEAGLLSFRRRDDSAEIIEDTTAYDPEAHRHWRLRDSAGTVFWETAEDGQAWTVQASAASPSSLGNATIAISAGTQLAVTAPGFAELDNALLEQGACP